jgi:class 3 adenylate cyclase
VLFCDVVGSTARAARLDPEEWRAIVVDYHRLARDVIARYDGHVAKNLGDGFLAYFGWPTAHEDDAERAARAGLAVVQALSGGATTKGLSVRVGIDTGPVVVADDGEVYGDTANIAARVQALAAPDTVLATAATHRLVSGLFIVEPQGAQTLKGVAGPVDLFRIVQPSGVRGRLAQATAAARTLTPFLGREDERRLLRRRFEQACEGEGQVVLLVGEAGIGKSRLAQMLHEDLRDVPHTWLEAGGQPYFAETPLYAITEMLGQFFAWRADDGPERRAESLARALEIAGLDPQPALPLVAPLLGVAVPADYPPVLAAPEVARGRLLATLAALALGNARLQPLVILLEDLHWVDASTLELFQLLVEQGATAPLLLLATARPDFRVPWPLRSHHTQLTLSPLPKKHARALVEAVAARAALPAPVVDAVIARTDGVPLFAEELTRAAVETGTTAVEDIPATLADSLMARLDRLGPQAKEVAQIGSAIGREFSRALLAAVTAALREPSPAELQPALDKLVAAELVWARGTPPDATYAFKHALVQDAAYGSLLKARRRALHGRIAHALAADFPALADAQPELLAHHYTRAAEAEPAVDAWRRAGRRFLRRGEPGAAVSALRQGVDVLQGMAESPGRAEREFRLQLALGQALTIAKGWSAPETTAAFARAQELGERADPGSASALLMGLWSATVNSEGPRAAEPLADQVLLAAERAGSLPMRTWAHFAQLVTRHYLGDLDGAREHARRGLEVYDEANAIAVPIDPRVAILGYAALAEVRSGYGDRARMLARQGVEQARRSKRPADRAWAGYFAATIFAILGDAGNAAAHVAQVREACTEEANPVLEAGATVLGGWAMMESGNTKDALATMRTGVAWYAATGQRVGLEDYLNFLADGLARAGRFDEALAVLAEAEGPCPGYEVDRPQTLRHRAELLARTGTPDAEVEATFADSLEIARPHGAKQYELRTATSYARWLRDHGRAAEAHGLLAPLYAWFTEGFDTRDLIEAKALLGELGG